ncbi:MAG: alpha/beta fold hydrolase [Candidatus Heimdallarchaeaceae archaeon]|jgi:hypothetical protein
MSKKQKNIYETLAVSEFEKEAESIELMMSDNATIRVLRTRPPEKTEDTLSLILVAGWGTVVISWDEFLLEAMKDFEVIYFESREKASCKLDKKSEVGMERMAYDLREVIEQLKLDEGKLVLFGSCLGATTIAFGLSRNMYDPVMPVLVAPPARFEVPPVLRLLVPIAPAFLFGAVKPIVRWWIKNFKTESPEQAAKYIMNLEGVNARQWKRVGLPLNFKRYWKMFPQVKDKSLLVAAEEDKMHDAEVTIKISKLMANSIYVNLGSNKNTHAPIMVETIREYIPEFKKS